MSGGLEWLQLFPTNTFTHGTALPDLYPIGRIVGSGVNE